MSTCFLLTYDVSWSFSSLFYNISLVNVHSKRQFDHTLIYIIHAYHMIYPSISTNPCIIHLKQTDKQTFHSLREKKKHKQLTHTETNNDTDSPATNGAPPFSHAQRQTHPSQPQIHKILTKCKAKELATPGRERTSGRAWQSGLAQTRVVPVDAVLEIYMKMTLNTKSQTVA